MHRKHPTLPFLLIPFILLLTGCQAFAPRMATPTSAPLPIITPSPLPTQELTSTSSPTATPSPLGCPEMEGRVEQLLLNDKKLGKPLPVNLFTPPCYNAREDVEYPLLILLHGQGYTASQWTDLGISQKASRMMAVGEISPFVIAMPQEDYFLLDVTQSAFGPAVINTMLPCLRQDFKICATKDCTAIGGISHGAVWSVLLGLQNGEMFGAIGAHSMPANPFPEYYLKELLAKMPQKPRFYMDSGRSDRYLAEASRFENSLNNIQLPHLWILQDGEHDDDYWRAHVEDYLRWYADPWRKNP